jgi:Na+/H+-dicarboxylate symporter
MIIGIIVGIFMGPEASMFKPLGDLFIQLIKMLVVPLVLVSIISGAAALGETKSAGLIGFVSIGFMMVTTVIAIVVALVLGEVFQPGVSVDHNVVNSLAAGYEVAGGGAAPAMGFWDTVIGMIPANPIQALTEGNILQIIIFGLFFGFGISALPAEIPVSAF